MAVHPISIIVRRSGDVVDRISRSPRRLPDGSIGAEYLGLVYPVQRGGQVDADGRWYYPAQAPICLDPPTELTDPGAAAWSMEDDAARPYLFLSGSEAVLLDVLRRLGEAGFHPERWGPSFREGSGGYLFDWFIRFPRKDLEAAPRPWELEQLFSDIEGSERMGSEEVKQTEALTLERLKRDHWLSDRVVEVERQLADEIRLRDAAEAGIEALRQSFNLELRRANEAAAFLRAALTHTTAVAGQLPSAQRTSEPTLLAQAAAAAKNDLDNALVQWIASEEALQRANQDLSAARARIAELESLATPSPRSLSEGVRLPGRVRGGLRELEATLAVFAPSIMLLRESAQFITIEVADRTDLYSKLRTLQVEPGSLRCKRVQAAHGWLELHFSTGLARDGRLYFSKLDGDAQPRWAVLVSDKASQPRDFEWISKQ